MNYPIEQINLSRREAFSLIRELINQFANSVRRCEGGDGFGDTLEDRDAETHGRVELDDTLRGYPQAEDYIDPHDFLEGALHFSDGSHTPANAELLARVREQLGFVHAGGQVSGYEEDKSQIVHDASSEFRQRITLYSKPAPAFMALGPFRDAQHTAAEIEVYRRPIHSSNPWSLKSTARTRNHGTRAERPAMVAYAHCFSFPVTQRGYAWKGECQGMWGTHHLCNDDTAYSVWHAYGNWNGGESCQGTKRTIAPSCILPWRPNTAPAAVFTALTPDFI